MDTKKFHKTCVKCHENFVYNQNDTWYDDHGTGYSTKLVKCPYCGQITILGYKEDKSLNVNNDRRFYDYNRK